MSYAASYQSKSQALVVSQAMQWTTQLPFGNDNTLPQLHVPHQMNATIGVELLGISLFPPKQTSRRVCELIADFDARAPTHVWFL